MNKKSYQLEGEEVGVVEGSSAEGSSAMGDEGQAVISLTPAIDCTGSASLLNSILSTLLKKMIQWCLGSSSIFPVTDDRVNTGLCSEWLLQPSRTVQVLGLLKGNPLAISCIVNLSGSSVTSSSSCLSSSFLWTSNFNRSSLINSWHTAASSTKSFSCRSSSE